MSDQAPALDPKRTALLVMDFQQGGTEDPDEQVRDVLPGRIFPRRAQVIDTATLRGLLSP
jgi:nicotinamidase-related amidase